jgi:hypothetical protein
MRWFAGILDISRALASDVSRHLLDKLSEFHSDEMPGSFVNTKIWIHWCATLTVTPVQISIHPDLNPLKTVEMVGDECLPLNKAHSSMKVAEKSFSTCMSLRHFPQHNSDYGKSLLSWKCFIIMETMHSRLSRGKVVVLAAGGRFELLARFEHKNR